MREDMEPELRIGFSALIPEPYIEDSRERLRCYKALSSAATPEAKSNWKTKFGIGSGLGPEELLIF